MKLYNNGDIRKLGPCYDPIRYYSDDKEYTLIDILDREDIPADDRIWVVTQLIPEKEARLFAVWCAREALKLVGNPDPRSIEACNVAERFAHGKATVEEIEAAWDAARDYYAAAWDAAIIWEAAGAAMAAAGEVAWEGACQASEDACMASQVVRAASGTTWEDARCAAKVVSAAQIEKLKEVILDLG